MKREIDEELRFHLEQRTAENIAAGMPPEEAARGGGVMDNPQMMKLPATLVGIDGEVRSCGRVPLLYHSTENSLL